MLLPATLISFLASTLRFFSVDTAVVSVRERSTEPCSADTSSVMFSPLKLEFFNETSPRVDTTDTLASSVVSVGLKETPSATTSPFSAFKSMSLDCKEEPSSIVRVFFDSKVSVLPAIKVVSLSMVRFPSPVRVKVPVVSSALFSKLS